VTLSDQNGYAHSMATAPWTRWAHPGPRERGAIYRSFVGLIMFSEYRWVRHKHCPRDVRSIPDSDRRTDVPGDPKRTKTRSSQRPSVHLSSFKPRKLGRPEENPLQSTPADCRAWKVPSIKKSSLTDLFCFYGQGRHCPPSSIYFRDSAS